MTTLETEKFFNEIKENEEYAVRVAQATAPEELVALFEEIGIQVTTQEAADWCGADPLGPYQPQL